MDLLRVHWMEPISFMPASPSATQRFLKDATCAGGRWDESRVQSTAGRCRL